MLRWLVEGWKSVERVCKFKRRYEEYNVRQLNRRDAENTEIKAERFYKRLATKKGVGFVKLCDP